MKQRSSRTSTIVAVILTYCCRVYLFMCKYNLMDWAAEGKNRSEKRNKEKAKEKDGEGEGETWSKVKWNNVKTIWEMTVSLYWRHLRAFVIVKQACDACDNAQQYDNYYNRYDNDIEKMRWEMKKGRNRIQFQTTNQSTV